MARCSSFLHGMLSFALLFTGSPSILHAQQEGINYEEAKIPPYTLPDPLKRGDGKKITTVREWEGVQRPAILKQFEDHMFGRYPGRPAGLRFVVRSVDSSALNGLAIRKQVRALFTGEESGPGMDILFYLPKKATVPVPVFTGLNFCGNHCVTTETDVPLSTQWMLPNEEKGVRNNLATEAARGAQAHRWPVEELMRKGYGLATAYYGDLEPDHPEGWKTGIRSTLKEQLRITPEEWAAAGAWAWGLSRIMDYLETEPAVDAGQVALTGHSRLGKAALWAGAQDPRFALVVSNNSGEGGAALSRRWYGETIARINTQFPHWFISRYKDYNNRPDSLPVDMHLLLSLIAPRPLYVASAEEDRWADPKGEFLGAFHTGPVYALYGKKGIPKAEMPPVQQPVGDLVRYHIRSGGHDIKLYDWQQYMEFADRWFRRNGK